MHQIRPAFLLLFQCSLVASYFSYFGKHRHPTVATFSSITAPSRRQSWELYSMEAPQSEEEKLEQRNLRFNGVGRLYTTSQTNQQDPHLQVVDRLASSKVMVVGLGGVGSWAAEALCRSGVGTLVLVDLDDVCISNSNRQLHAMSSTIGKFKIDALEKRFRDINPDLNVELIHDFVSADNIDEILSERVPDLTACLDAIDGAKGKSALIAACARHQIPIVTCGGSAGRTDPSAYIVEDLSRVAGDPLFTACRKQLRQAHGFEAGKPFKSSGKLNRPPRKWNIPAVFSTEPQKSLPQGSDASSLRRCDGALGTGCFVTGTSGFVAAGQIVSMIAKDKLVVPRTFQGNLSLKSKTNQD